MKYLFFIVVIFLFSSCVHEHNNIKIEYEIIDSDTVRTQIIIANKLFYEMQKNQNTIFRRLYDNDSVMIERINVNGKFELVGDYYYNKIGPNVPRSFSYGKEHGVGNISIIDSIDNKRKVTSLFIDDSLKLTNYGYNINQSRVLHHISRENKVDFRVVFDNKMMASDTIFSE